MASEVEICNVALSRLGASRITSLTEGTSEAKLCNTVFDDVVEEVMNEGAWTTLIRRADLNRLTVAPEFEYSYQFQLPTDPKILRIISTNDDYSPYSIEGDKLLTDNSSVKIKYIARITDTNEFGPNLQRAVLSRLTAELCYPITGSKDMSEQLYNKYLSDLSSALSADGQQGSVQILKDVPSVTVRY